MKAAAFPKRIESGASGAGPLIHADPQSILDAIPVGAIIIEIAAIGPICRAANLAFEQWADLARHRALGLPIARLPIVGSPAFLAAIDAQSPYADWYDESDRHFIAHLSPIPGSDGRLLALVREPQRETVSGPSYDVLTGLPDRAAFHNWTAAALAARMLGEGEVAVLMIDLDRLATVNESLGYAMGDHLLRAVTERLKGGIGEGNLLARIAGDRFGVLATGLAGTAAAMTLASRLTHTLMTPFSIEGCDIFVTAGVGIATTAPRECTSEELIRDSELAMHRAKREGANRIELYQPMPLDIARDRFLLESDIRRACERDQLFLMYQSIVDLETGRVSGFEALARWQHPQRGLVSPNEFIPVAEASGAIIQIGRWALTTACAQLGEWRRRLGAAAEHLQISVNLSVIQLARDDVVAAVTAALSASGIPADRLKIELTESVIVENPDRAIALLHRLKALGVTIAMDDFGTGYSSLSALNSLPIDVLKVDRSFVSGMGNSRDSYKIVDAILSLARSLGLSTTAEGVETQQEADLLRGLGCQSGQGYLFAKPMRADAAETYLIGTTLP